MESKIRINLSQGVFEVEGEPDFVRGIYDDFKLELTKLATQKQLPMNDNPQLTSSNQDDVINVDVEQSSNQKPAKKHKAKKAKSAANKESYKIQDINTGLPGEPDSVFAYLDKYKPKSNIQKNTVFIKYLQDKHPQIKITLDHVYTCYANAGVKPSGALYASMLDTGKASKGYGYIDSSDIDNLKVVQKGEVLLHELEQKAKSNES